MKFFERAFEAFPELAHGDVIDFGSLNINGGPHELIKPRRYVGVDLSTGPNVDLAVPSQLVALPSEEFDIAMSSECFEHNPYWRETFAQMCRLTKPGGLVVWTTATTGRFEHGTSRSDGHFSAPLLSTTNFAEYYRNVPRREAVTAVAVEFWFDAYLVFEHHRSRDLYFIGLRRGASQDALLALRQFGLAARAELPRQVALLRNLIPFELADPLLQRIPPYLTRKFVSRVLPGSLLRVLRRAHRAREDRITNWPS